MPNSASEHWPAVGGGREAAVVQKSSAEGIYGTSLAMGTVTTARRSIRMDVFRFVAIDLFVFIVVLLPLDKS
jgi:hypothetical protein